MIGLSELPARLLGGQRRCCYHACTQKSDWSRVFRGERGIDVEGQWVCSAACFLGVAQELIANLSESRTPVVSTRTHLPLGLVMVSRGEVSSGQLRAALEYQQKSRQGKRIGDVFKELGIADDNQIMRALAEQWSIPIFPLHDPEVLVIPERLPMQLLETYRTLPVHFAPAARVLLLGFVDTLHRSLLYAVEQMLGCRTEPCLVQPNFYRRQLELLRGNAENSEIVIDTSTTVIEAAQIALNYAQQLEAATARIVSCGQYLWIRLDPNDFHLLLRFPAATATLALSSEQNPSHA